MIKKGDFVTASMVGTHDGRQGIYIGPDDDGTIQVLGFLDLYHCYPNITKVPDKNLWGDTLKEVLEFRRGLINASSQG